ncbi:stalk domain-containing protein [Chengkuizengella sp. SCS-71B]|uniref:stalk domain-containing protein n=1 Tax=Chengkuizengella sp. SCS-71B TaxID=3115290 RepID=UPI0032C246DA
MKKTAILLTLSGTLLFGGIQFSLADSSISSQPIAMELALFDLQQSSEATVESKEYTFQNEFVVVEGELPVVKGLKDGKFQKEVNEQIKQFVEQKTAEVEKQSKVFNDEQKELGDDALSGPHDSPTGPYRLFINYEVKISGNMVSIVFKTYTMGYIAANGINEVDSINIIDDAKGHIVELEHFVTDREKLNQLIQKEIESNEQLFKDSFESIREDQGYYVENEKLNVVFNEYEIAAGYVGTPVIKIPLSKLSTVSDQNNNDSKNKVSYYTKTVDEAQITMVSLRDLGKYFDYKVKWEPKTRSVILFKGMTQISIKEGDRKVFIDDEKSVVLELTSASYKNRVYVPISFAETVLGETIKLDEKNEIKIEK